MNKFLKYKAWDVKNNKMLFDLTEYYDMQELFKGEDLIKLQCSGEKDKNNKLIYNGDIIKRQNRYIGVVIFEPGCFKIKWQDGLSYPNANQLYTFIIHY